MNKAGTLLRNGKHEFLNRVSFTVELFFEPIIYAESVIFFRFLSFSLSIIPFARCDVCAEAVITAALHGCGIRVVFQRL